MNGTIYLITNIINQKQYVGQTRQRPEDRIRQHFCAAMQGEQCALYNAIRKYGAQNFQWEILDEPDIDDLDEYEMAWITRLDTYHNGYNETVGGGGGGKLSSQEIDNMLIDYQANMPTSELCQKYNISADSMRRYAFKAQLPSRGIIGHKVSCIDPNTGRIIQIYDSITDAADQTQIGIRGHIKEVCDGKMLTAGGYYWSDKIEGHVGDVVELPDNIKNRLVVRSVFQYDLNHQLVAEYPSIIAAARALGSTTKRKDISEACRGLKRRVDAHHYNGFLWYFD